MHRTFPATLYRFQTHRDSKLFDKAFEQDDWEYEDGVEISEDGLVHPNVTLDGTQNANGHYSYANLVSFKWRITHAKYALHARDHTTLV